jgi:hypothetical protein
MNSGTRLSFLSTFPRPGQSVDPFSFLFLSFSFNEIAFVVGLTSEILPISLASAKKTKQTLNNLKKQLTNNVQPNSKKKQTNQKKMAG